MASDPRIGTSAAPLPSDGQRDTVPCEREASEQPSSPHDALRALTNFIRKPNEKEGFIRRNDRRPSASISGNVDFISQITAAAGIVDTERDELRVRGRSGRITLLYTLARSLASCVRDLGRKIDRLILRYETRERASAFLRETSSAAYAGHAPCARGLYSV